ncbi:MAG: hypothetical protein ACF8GE_00715 [Phycisphaerales bacterium JB043]
MIQFTCPKCGGRLSGDESNVGASIECPSCQNVSVVPAHSVAPERSAPARVVVQRTGVPYTLKVALAFFLAGFVVMFWYMLMTDPATVSEEEFAAHGFVGFVTLPTVPASIVGLVAAFKRRWWGAIVFSISEGFALLLYAALIAGFGWHTGDGLQVLVAASSIVFVLHKESRAYYATRRVSPGRGLAHA